MKVKLIILGIGILFILSFLSCTDKVALLRTETVALASELNTVFVEGTRTTIKLANAARDLVIKSDSVSIDDMVVGDEGNFVFINGFFNTKKDYGMGVITAVDHNRVMEIPSEPILKTAKIISTDFAEIAKKTYEENDIIATINYIQYTEKNTVAFTFPYYDILSTLPPTDKLLETLGGHLRVLPFFDIITKKNNPEKKIIWFNDINIQWAIGGISLNCFAPIYLNEDDADCTAEIIYEITVNELNKKYILDKEGLYIVIVPSGNICGLSQAAMDTFDLDLPYFDYLTESKTNDLGDNFKLNAIKEPGIKELGEKVLNGEKELEVSIMDTQYTTIVADIPESGFKVIGLIKK